MRKWANYARKLDIGLLCPNMKIRPRAPKMEFFKIFSFLWKGLQISLPMSPQIPPNIKFKSSYARKHIIKKVKSRTQLLNPRVDELPVLHLRGLWILLYTTANTIATRRVH